MNEYRYILQPYHTKADRTTCPHCGHRGEFSLYIDTITGKPVDSSVGRCNREKSCGYHRTPAEYFKEHPEMRPKESRVEGNARTFGFERKDRFDVLPPRFIPTSVAIEASNLFKFFCTKFGEVNTREVFARYRVGASKHWRNDGGLATAFPQIDEQGLLRQMKVMAYNPATGKRLHKEHPAERLAKSGYFTDVGQADKVWFAGKTLLGNAEAQLRQCFFGQHLLPKFSDVSIVESEKTAMIASLFFPKSCWLATGGKNGCRWTSKEVASVLTGKKVMLYPDLGCYSDWKKNADILRSYGVDVQVSSFLEKFANTADKEKGLDIGDYLLRQPISAAKSEEHDQSSISVRHEENNAENRKQMSLGDFLAYAQEKGHTLSRVGEFSFIVEH